MLSLMKERVHDLDGQLSMWYAMMKSSMSPIDALPNEVLGTVFAFAVDGQPSSSMCALRISHTSLRWRNISLAQPSLWSVFDFEPPSGKEMELLDLWLSRINPTSPLTITASSTVVAMSLTLRRMSSKLSHLHIIDLERMWRPSSILGRGVLLPNLECLSISLPSRHQSSSIVIQAPKLPTLSIYRGLDFSRLFIYNSSLTSLHLHDTCVTDGEWADILRQWPSLMHLHLIAVAIDIQRSDDPLVLHTLTSLQTINMSLCCPNLATYLLRIINAPNLGSLEYNLSFSEEWKKSLNEPTPGIDAAYLPWANLMPEFVSTSLALIDFRSLSQSHQLSRSKHITFMRLYGEPAYLHNFLDTMKGQSPAHVLPEPVEFSFVSAPFPRPYPIDESNELLLRMARPKLPHQLFRFLIRLKEQPAGISYFRSLNISSDMIGSNGLWYQLHIENTILLSYMDDATSLSERAYVCT